MFKTVLIIISLFFSINLAAQTLPPQNVIVLMYHRIINQSDELWQPDSLSVLKNDFEDQIKWLKNNGYTSMTISELGNYMRGQTISTKKRVVITFDDGWTNQYINAVPILKKYNFKATFFIFTNTDWPGYFMTWDQIRDIASNNKFEIGGHTKTHPSIFTEDMVPDELGYSKVKTEFELDAKKIKSLAWPYGFYTTDLTLWASFFNFTNHVTVDQVWPNNLSGNGPGQDPLQIKRIYVDGRCDISKFILQMNTGITPLCSANTLTPTLMNNSQFINDVKTMSGNDLTNLVCSRAKQHGTYCPH